MELKIREIIFDDLYEFLKIIEDVELNYKPDPKKTTEQIGIEAIKHLIANIHTAREKFNTFLGSLVGKTGEEFGKLPMKDSAKVLNVFIKELKEADFFSLSTLISKYMGQLK